MRFCVINVVAKNKEMLASVARLSLKTDTCQQRRQIAPMMTE